MHDKSYRMLATMHHQNSQVQGFDGWLVGWLVSGAPTFVIWQHS